jgi:signal transduction histidine kinase
MPDQKVELSQLYHAALQRYLRQATGSDLEPARELGRQAVAMGLETLDMARVHEIALVALVLPGYAPNTSSALMGRAGLFFAESITPIEQTHRGAREANAQLNHIVRKLARSVETLQGEIVQRNAVEAALRDSEQLSLRLLDKSHQMEESLRSLSRKLLSAQEDERRRISRELHDVIAQTLTGINVRLSILKIGAHADATALADAIASTQHLVEQSIDVVRRFARELRPTMLDDLGLIPALRSFMETFLKDTGVRVSFTVFAGIERCDSAVRTMLYRVALEALTNVARHAKASRVALVIQDVAGGIRMEVTDDGTGFEVDGTASVRRNNRLGLVGMRERVEMTGGTFHIISTPGHPTTIRVEIPSDHCEALQTQQIGSADDPMSTSTAPAESDGILR